MIPIPTGLVITCCSVLILKARRGKHIISYTLYRDEQRERGVSGERESRESAEPESAPPGTCVLTRLSGGDTCTYAIVIKL